MRRRALERDPISNAFNTAASSPYSVQQGCVGLLIQYRNRCHFLFCGWHPLSGHSDSEHLLHRFSLFLFSLRISLRKEFYSNSLMCCYRHVIPNYSVMQLCPGVFLSSNPFILCVSLSLSFCLQCVWGREGQSAQHILDSTDALI